MTSRSAFAIAVVGAALLLPSTAFAQSAPQPSSGPMTIERMHSGFYGGGDVKITDFNHHTSELVGGEGGWVWENAFFIGGAGYWLANGGHDDELAYGGLVLQWMIPASKPGHVRREGAHRRRRSDDGPIERHPVRDRSGSACDGSTADPNAGQQRRNSPPG